MNNAVIFIAITGWSWLERFVHNPCCFIASDVKSIEPWVEEELSKGFRKSVQLGQPEKKGSMVLSGYRSEFDQAS